MIRVLFCFFAVSAYCEIIEVKHFVELKEHVDSETLVLLDIDDTLLLPTQTLGTDIWFQYRCKQHQEWGLSKNAALQKALAEWEAIRHLTNVQIVEPGTDQIVQSLQEQRISVMGLTTQGLALATRTVQQLRGLNIDLIKTAPSNQDHYFMNGHGVLYRQGVLFTSGTEKGQALLHFFEITGYWPKRVVFINDKATHLADVDGALAEAGIEFLGLRYSYGDARVAQFSAEIADIEWIHSTLGHLLSDEEAKNFYR